MTRWAKAILDLDLMPWQQLALDGQLEHREDGSLCHRSSLVTCARQNGKSVALRALIGWWLTEGAIVRGQPQTVVSTAHRLDLASRLFSDLAPQLETKFGATLKWSYGRNEAVLPDGSKWLVQAASNSAGHGLSADLVVADEVWSIGEEVIDQGLLPSQRARRSPLFSAWSTAGTEDSKWMMRAREEGLRIVDAGKPSSLYFAEWSVHPTDVDNPERWVDANPALGHLIDLETLIAEANGPNRAAFLRASLNMWISTANGWLEPNLWNASLTEQPFPEPALLAIESSLDESRFYGLTAHLLPDGRCGLSVAFQVSSETEAWAEVRRLCTPSIKLLVTPGLDLHCPMEYAKRKEVVGFQELGRWTQLVRTMIQEGRVVHHGEQSLTDHMLRAVASRHQAGIVLSANRSPGSIDLARMAVWAVARATKAGWTVSKPAVGGPRR